MNTKKAEMTKGEEINKMRKYPRMQAFFDNLKEIKAKKYEGKIKCYVLFLTNINKCNSV